MAVRQKSRPVGASTRPKTISKLLMPKPNNSPGFFITLEGGEGTGKSSQMALLKERFNSLGREVVTSREPGGSIGAEAVRHVLLSGAAEPFGADMEAILFSASRADHVDTVIRPALKSGKIVISDRFFDSTRVYQGVSGKVDRDLVRRLEKIACGDTWPDLTLVIDLEPEEGMKRASARRNAGEVPDRFEKESIKLQEMRREAYLKIALEEPNRCKIVDGSGTPEVVFKRIWKIVEKQVGQNCEPVSAKNKPQSVKSNKRKLVSHKKLTAKKHSPNSGNEN